MELIESSGNWIIVLGKTLLNSLWIGMLIYFLLKAFLIAVPQKFSGIRYLASLLSLLVFSALTAALFAYLYTPDENIAKSFTTGIFPPAQLPQLTDAGNSAVNLLYQLVSIAYFAGMGVYLLLTLPVLGKIRVLRKEATAINGPPNQLFIKLLSEAGIRRKVEFLVSEHVSGPFLTGVLKPALIVPAAMLSQLSFREIEAILMHEIHHLRKLDHVVNLLQKIAEVCFFFNPAVWLISGSIRAEREKRCDDLVLAGSTRALDYARALYTLSNRENSLGMRATAATGRGKGELLRRIERILKTDTMKTNYQEKLKSLLIFAFGIGIVLLVSGFTSGFSIKLHNDEPQTDPQIVDSPVPQTDPEHPAALPAPQDTLSEKEQERIRNEVSEALRKAHAEVDWDKIRDDMEQARIAAMEDIDWEEIREEMEQARIAAMEEIDWEEIREEMEQARIAAMEDIDWEEIREEMEQTGIAAMEEIDWEEIREEIKAEMENIDWEQMKTEMAEMRIQIDSMLADFDFDFDSFMEDHKYKDLKVEKK